MTRRIAVVGAGYVGLTTAACMAHLDHAVTCADIDREKIHRLRRGEVPILEKGLDNLVAAGLQSGRLTFTDDVGAAAGGAEFVYLAVPTPQGVDGSVDLAQVEAAARQMAPHLQPESIVINKSTVPVGSTDAVGQVLGRGDVFIVSNPEFLREGSAVHDFLHPDRIVIGADDQAAAIRVAGLYAAIPAPLIVTDPASAELVKYASNAFLATKVSFVNAIAALCEAVGADVNDVVLGMGYDKRIGEDFLRPGPGWGGSCLPKDTAALVRIGDDAGYDFGLLRGVISANEEQFDRVVAKVREQAGGSLDGARVAVWGITFKAGTDDRRASPAISVMSRLVAEGAQVVAHDPAVKGPLEELPEIELAADPYAACEGAQVLAVLTEWDQFRWLDFAKVGSLLAQRRVVDARNLLDRRTLLRHGFVHTGIGRGRV